MTALKSILIIALAGYLGLLAIMYVALNLLIDMLYGVIDPRVRLEG